MTSLCDTPEPCICGVSAGIWLRLQPDVHLPIEEPAAPTLQEADTRGPDSKTFAAFKFLPAAGGLGA